MEGKGGVQSPGADGGGQVVSDGRGDTMLGEAGGVRQTGHRVAEPVPPLRCVGLGTLTRPPWVGGGGDCGPGNMQVSGRSRQRRVGKGGWKVEEQRSRKTRGGGRGVSWNKPKGGIHGGLWGDLRQPLWQASRLQPGGSIRDPGAEWGEAAPQSLSA